MVCFLLRRNKHALSKLEVLQPIENSKDLIQESPFLNLEVFQDTASSVVPYAVRRKGHLKMQRGRWSKVLQRVIEQMY